MFVLHAHLVFVTKYRRQVFSQAMLDTLRDSIVRVCDDFEVELVEFNGEPDHVHLLVNYPPKVALARLVNSLKGVSSRRLRQAHPDVRRHLWGGHLWSPSYFAGSVGGAPLTVLRRYIEAQR